MKINRLIMKLEVLASSFYFLGHYLIFIWDKNKIKAESKVILN